MRGGCICGGCIFGKQFMFADDTTFTLVIYGNTRADIERNTNKALAAIETYKNVSETYKNAE